MRPLYETSNDLQNEASTLKMFLSKYQMQAHKLPIAYQLDYWLEGNGKRAVAEIKCRKHTYGTFPTYMLSMHKWREGVRYADLGIPFVLVIGYTDGVWLYKYKSDDDFSYAWGGRSTKQRDDQDQEPCVYIPIKLFGRVG